MSGDAGLAGDREQVQDAVRRAAGRRDAGHRVQERAPVEEAPRGHALLGELRRRARRRARRPRPSPRARPPAIEPVADARDAEAVERDRHRVGGEVAGARAGAGAGVALELVELRARRSARAPRAPTASQTSWIVTLAAAPAAGAHRPAVEDDRRLVDARERHQRGRHRLVAADEADERRRSRARAPSARSSRRSPRARSARRASRASPCDWLSETAIVLKPSGDAAGRGRRRSPTRSASSRWLRLHGIVPRPRRGDADDRAVEPRRVDAHRAEVRARGRALGRSASPARARRRSASCSRPTMRLYVGRVVAVAADTRGGAAADPAALCRSPYPPASTGEADPGQRAMCSGSCLLVDLAVASTWVAAPKSRPAETDRADRSSVLDQASGGRTSSAGAGRVM